jgi:predicted Zn-dependent protease
MVDSGPGDPEAARALLDAVLAADAKNVAALAVRAGLALAQGDAEAALADLGLALGEAPRQADLLLLAAEAQRRLGNAVLAGEHLARAVQAAGFAPAETLAYAGFLEGQARAPEAEAVLAEAARRRPGDAAILARLAELRLGLGDWPGAETVAAELRRIEAAGLADRISAAALAGRGEHEAGILLLERLAADPGARERAMAALVEAYLAAGTPERAAAFLDGLLEGEPGHPQALLLRAALAERAGDAAAAEADLRALAAARPDLARAHLGLAEFLLRRGGEGAEAAAEAALRAGLAAVPEDPALRFRLATLAERRGETRAAIAGYEALLAERPGSLLLVNNVVSLIADHHADDPELLARARAIAAPLRAATAPELQDTYGWLLHLSGDDAGALRSLQPAAAALPGNPWVRYHLGMTLAALGRKDGARDHLGAALAQGGADFPPAAAIRAALAGLGP